MSFTEKMELNLFNIMPPFFRLGQLAASIQSKGYIHPDFTINNIGFSSDGLPKFVDYADMLEYPFSDYLADNTLIDKSTLSLMPILRPLIAKDDFLNASWFRLGYICCGGKLADITFCNLFSLKKIDSRTFYDRTPGMFNFKSVDTLTDTEIEVYNEWSNLDLYELFSKYLTLDNYCLLPLRNKLNNINKYYLDSCFLNVYYYFLLKINDKLNASIALLNICEKEFAIDHYYTAFGLLKLIDIPEFCEPEIKQHVATQICKTNAKLIEVTDDEIRKIIEKILTETADFPQLLWILFDIDCGKLSSTII